jgi:hypothetical protein
MNRKCSLNIYIWVWCKACLVRRRAFPRPLPSPFGKKLKSRRTHGIMEDRGLSNPVLCCVPVLPSV